MSIVSALSTFSLASVPVMNGRVRGQRPPGRVQPGRRDLHREGGVDGQPQAPPDNSKKRTAAARTCFSAARAGPVR
jgi:hypothetical protein